MVGKIRGKAIEVLDSTGAIQLQNNNDSSHTINAYFIDGSGNRYNSVNNTMNNTIAQFFPNQSGQHATFNTEVEVDPQFVFAGSYSGQVYFSIMCE